MEISALELEILKMQKKNLLGRNSHRVPSWFAVPIKFCHTKKNPTYILWKPLK
jgi:hypothetical protein